MINTHSSVKRDFTYSLISKFIIFGTGLVSQSMIARLLGPSGRGSYAVCLVFSTLLSTVCMLGVDMATTNFVSSRKCSLSEGVLYTIIFGGIGTIASWIIGAAILQFPLEFVNKASKAAFYMSMLSIPLVLFSQVFKQLLTAVNNFKGYAILWCLAGVLQVFFVALYVYLLEWGVVGALFAHACTCLAAMIATLIYFKIRYGLELCRPEWNKFKALASYGFRYYFGKISNITNVQMGTIIIAFFCTDSQVGIFSVASMLASQAMFLPDTLSVVLVPKSAAHKDGRSELVASLTRLMTVVSGGIYFFMFCLAYFLIVWLFGAEYRESIVILRILCFGYFMRSVSKLFVPYLLGIGRPGLSSVSVFVGVVLNIIILVIFLPFWGIRAAAIGVCASYLTSSILLYWGFCHYSGIRVLDTFMIRKSDLQKLVNLVPFRVLKSKTS